MHSDQVQAAFEAGIKLGALYHQWVGTPVSPATAHSVEEAIEQAVALQPFVEEISVRLETGEMQPNVFGYSELAGTMFSVEIMTRVGNAVCLAGLAREGAYPLMKIFECR